MKISILKLKPNTRVHFIGAEPVILKQDYDDRQSWLPFVAAVLVSEQDTPKNDEKQQTPPTRKKLTHRWNSVRFAAVENARLYEHVKGVPQIVLPFSDRRAISQNEAKRLRAAEFPGFERDAQGRIAEFEITPAQREAILEWCGESGRGRYGVRGRIAIFELWDDAIMARLYASAHG